MLTMKAKVTDIWTIKISKMVTDRANITIAIKYEIELMLSISFFKFDFVLFFLITFPSIETTKTTVEIKS